MDLMTEACIQKAKSVWVGLQSKLVTLGWRDKRTKITLFEAYVRSVLLFGSAIWGVKNTGCERPHWGGCYMGIWDFL